MISPPNHAKVPTVIYEYIFYPPSSDRLQPTARRRAWGLLSRSSTLGTLGHQLRPKILNTTGFLQ
jgi:hypothetical protein